MRLSRIRDLLRSDPQSAAILLRRTFIELVNSLASVSDSFSILAYGRAPVILQQPTPPRKPIHPCIVLLENDLSVLCYDCRIETQGFTEDLERRQITELSCLQE
jgi:hypothetical protein